MAVNYTSLSINVGDTNASLIVSHPSSRGIATTGYDSSIISFYINDVSGKGTVHITGLKAGTTTISFKDNLTGNSLGSCTVTVVGSKTLSLSGSSSMDIGGSITLTAVGSDGTYPTVTRATSSNSNIASVNYNGSSVDVVSEGTAGTVTITAYTSNYGSAQKTITVSAPVTYNVTFNHYYGSTLLGTTSATFSDTATHYSAAYSEEYTTEESTGGGYDPDFYLYIRSAITDTQLSKINPYWRSYSITTPYSYSYSSSNPSSFSSKQTVSIYYSRSAGTPYRTYGSYHNDPTSTVSTESHPTWSFKGYYASSNPSSSDTCYGITEGTISYSGSQLYSRLSNNATLYACYISKLDVRGPDQTLYTGSSNTVYLTVTGTDGMSISASSDQTSIIQIGSISNQGSTSWVYLNGIQAGTTRIKVYYGSNYKYIYATCYQNKVIPSLTSTTIALNDTQQILFTDSTGKALSNSYLNVDLSPTGIVTTSTYEASSNGIIFTGATPGSTTATVSYTDDSYHADGIVNITVTKANLTNVPVITKVSGTHAELNLKIANNNNVDCTLYVYLNGSSTAISYGTVSANSYIYKTISYTDETTDYTQICGYFTATNYNNSAASSPVTFYRNPATPSIYTLISSSKNNDIYDKAEVSFSCSTSGSSIYYRKKVDNGTWSDFILYSGGTLTYTNDTFSDQAYDIQAYAVKNDLESTYAERTFTLEHQLANLVLNPTSLTIEYGKSSTTTVTKSDGSTFSTSEIVSVTDSSIATVEKTNNSTNYGLKFTATGIGTEYLNVTLSGYNSPNQLQLTCTKTTSIAPTIQILYTDVSASGYAIVHFKLYNPNNFASSITYYNVGQSSSSTSSIDARGWSVELSITSTTSFTGGTIYAKVDGDSYHAASSYSTLDWSYSALTITGNDTLYYQESNKYVVSNTTTVYKYTVNSSRVGSSIDGLTITVNSNQLVHSKESFSIVIKAYSSTGSGSKTVTVKRRPLVANYTSTINLSIGESIIVSYTSEGSSVAIHTASGTWTNGFSATYYDENDVNLLAQDIVTTDMGSVAINMIKFSGKTAGFIRYSLISSKYDDCDVCFQVKELALTWIIKDKDGNIIHTGHKLFFKPFNGDTVEIKKLK